MTDRMKKAPAATGAIRNRSTNYQKEEPMTTIVPEATVNGQTDEFATIHVAGCVVTADTLTGGDEADELVVTVTMPDRFMTFTPEAICALAAAMSSVGVHQMEERPREIRRRTEAGAPSFEEAL